MKVRPVYGNWLPTPYLRYREGILEQKMRRRVKEHPHGSPAYHYYEYEWQSIKDMTE